MLHGNFDPSCPTLVRIGNLLPNGDKRDGKKEGANWH